MLFRNAGFIPAIVCGLMFTQLGFAADSPVTSAKLNRVGFSGRFKVGQSTPLTVQVETNAPCRWQLQVETSDPEGNRAVWTADYVATAAGTHHQTMLFHPGRLQTMLRPRLLVHSADGDPQMIVPVESGEEPGTQLQQVALMRSVMLVGTLGNPGGVTEDISEADEADEQAAANQTPIQVFAFNDLSQLLVTTEDRPETKFINAAGLEAVDTILMAGQFPVTALQSQAIQTWVSLGGHLIVTLGEDYEAYTSSPLSAWLTGESADPKPPFRIAGTTTYRSLNTLESFAGRNAAPIAIDLQKPVRGVKIESGEHAEPLLSVLSGPLILRAPYGFGTVTLIGLSFAEEPVKSWKSLPRVVRKLLSDVKQATGTKTKTSGSQLAYSGVSELSTQLHTALQTFRPVQRLSTWGIIGLMTVYLLVIGPLDYLLVHQVLGQPRLTWLTFPVWVALAGVLAVGLSRSHNGQTLITNQVNVLDYDVATEILRTRSWASLYSPESRRYEVRMQAAEWDSAASKPHVPAPVRMSWFGTPETTFGGMYREGGQPLAPPLYQFSDRAKSIANLPIPIWGSKVVQGEWFEQGQTWVESDLESPRPGQLRGSIRHNFPVPITDWFLAYNTRVFLPRTNLATEEPDPFPPKTDWPRNDPKWERIVQREISGYLTRAVAKQFKMRDSTRKEIEAFRMEQAPYEPLADGHSDPFGEIVRMISFHRQVGGKQYTKLDNHAFRSLDLSGRLGLNRAVLYGRLSKSPTVLEVKDHQPETGEDATFVRIVLPVRINHSEDERPINLDQK